MFELLIKKLVAVSKYRAGDVVPSRESACGLCGNVLLYHIDEINNQEFVAKIKAKSKHIDDELFNREQIEY